MIHLGYITQLFSQVQFDILGALLHLGILTTYRRRYGSCKKSWNEVARFDGRWAAAWRIHPGGNSSRRIKTTDGMLLFT